MTALFILYQATSSPRQARGCPSQWRFYDDSAREVWRSKHYLEHYEDAKEEAPNREAPKVEVQAVEKAEVKPEVQDAAAPVQETPTISESVPTVKPEGEDLDHGKMSDDAVEWLKMHVPAPEDGDMAIAQDEILFRKLQGHLPEKIITWYMAHERLYAEYLASDVSILQDFDYACIHYCMRVFDVPSERAEHFCDVLNWCLDMGFGEEDSYRVAEGFLTVETGATLDIDLYGDGDDSPAEYDDTESKEDDEWIDDDDEVLLLEEKPEETKMCDVAGIRRRKKRIGRYKRGR